MKMTEETLVGLVQDTAVRPADASSPMGVLVLAASIRLLSRDVGAASWPAARQLSPPLRGQPARLPEPEMKACCLLAIHLSSCVPLPDCALRFDEVQDREEGEVVALGDQRVAP